MALLTTVPPTSEPVTLAQVKQFARVDFPDDDTLWPSLISAAREWCEVYCKRRFIQRTMRLELDFFPGYVDLKAAGQKVSSPFVSGSNAVLVGVRYAIMLPYPRVRSIVTLNYIDPNGNQQTLNIGPARSSAPFLYDLDGQPARIAPNAQTGTMWPVAMVTLNAIQVDYVTGYGMQLTVTTSTTTAVITSPYIFLPTDVGRQISIPGAAAGGATLTTTVLSVDNSGNATLAATPATATTTGLAYLGDPVPLGIQVAIMRLALLYYEYRTTAVPDTALVSVKEQLSPFRDLRF